MCPGVAVLAGNGDGGGGSGKGGKNGKGKKGAGTGDGDEDASGDGTGAGECGDPVCPVTGKVFLEFLDFAFAGPFPLRWIRHYNSRGSDRAGDLGHGWSHPFGWRVHLKRRAALVYDDKHREQRFETPPRTGEPVWNGFAWNLRRHQDGLLLRLPDGRSLSFTRSPAATDWFLLTSIADKNGNAITLQRDARGTIVALIDSAGRPYRFQCDGAGRIRSIAVAIEPSHQQWMEVARYEYDAAGNLASFTDAESFVFRYSYVRNLLAEHRTACGLSYCYRYDGVTAEASCVETWGEYVGQIDSALDTPIPPRPSDGPDTRKVKGINYRRLTYMKQLRYTEVENGLGGVERYFGDETGRVVKHVTFTGAVKDFAFDPQSGAVIAYSDELGAERRVLTTESGGPLGQVGPDGKGVVTRVTEDGSHLSFDELRGTTTERRFDERGNLVYARYADDTIEEWTYDARGLVVEQRERSGAVFSYRYDAQGNPVRVLHGSTLLFESEFDYLGRRVLAVDSAGGRTEWRYDARSEIVWKLHDDGSEIRIVRDANRDPVSIEIAGSVRRIEYGGFRWATKITEPDGSEWHYRYNVEGNLVRIVNPRGQELTQQYDLAARWIGCTTFEGIELASVRNEYGQTSSHTRPTGTDVRSYDEQGRIIGAEMPDGTAVSVEYGAWGPIKIDNGIVPLELEYNAMGVIERDKQGKLELQLEWRGGSLAKVKTNAGLPVAYDHDAFGDVTRIRVGSVDVRQEPSGTDWLTYLGKGLVLRQTYTPTMLLRRQVLARFDPNIALDRRATSADPNVVYWSTYDYSDRAIVTGERHSDGRSVEYELDAADRIRERRAYRNGILVAEERLAYDLAGTPLVPGAKYDALMRPSELRGETFEYDESGRLSRRMTDAGEWRYEWDAHDNLVRVVAPTHLVELDYDGRGRRCRKRVRRDDQLVKSVRYGWSNDVVLHEVDDLEGQTRTYVRRNDAWFPSGHVDARGGDETACFYLTGPSNAPAIAFDDSGRVVWDAETTVFGVLDTTVSDVDVTARFAGQFWDEDVGLVYNRKRWYDPRLGVYVSPDPLTVEGNPNPRDYVPNPTRYADPMGEVRGDGYDPPRPTRTRPFGSPPDGWARPPRPGPGGINTGYLSGPGHWATNGTPACPGWVNCPPGALNAAGNPLANAVVETGPGAGMTVRDAIDQAGRTYGCHSCGSRNPNGPDATDTTGHFVPDHQPPACMHTPRNGSRGVNRGDIGGDGVRLLPHCRQCSGAQGRGLGTESRSTSQAEFNRRGAAAIRTNRGLP